MHTGSESADQSGRLKDANCLMLVYFVHTVYGLKRRDVFVNAVSNELYNIDDNYENYRNKITEFVQNKDIDSLARQLFLQPNMLMSFVFEYSQNRISLTKYSNKVFLQFIGRCMDPHKPNNKLYALFLQRPSQA